MLEGHSDIVYGAAFSPDGKLLATASGDSTTRLWNVGTGACARVLNGHTGIVSAVAFSPDGALVATASFDGTARLWEVATGNCLRILSGHADTVWSVAFSPAERVVATASEDATARIWDAASGLLDPHAGGPHRLRVRGRLQPGRQADRHRELGHHGPHLGVGHRQVHPHPGGPHGRG